MLSHRTLRMEALEDRQLLTTFDSFESFRTLAPVTDGTDGIAGTADYDVWRSNFGHTPGDAEAAGQDVFYQMIIRDADKD